MQKLWRETVRGETTREENSFFSEHTWITFIHLEKSSPCQLIPDSSKGWKSHHQLAKYAQDRLLCKFDNSVSQFGQKIHKKGVSGLELREDQHTHDQSNDAANEIQPPECVCHMASQSLLLFLSCLQRALRSSSECLPRPSSSLVPA
jgi:hypothetical protein